MKQNKLKLIREEGYKIFYLMLAQTILIALFFWMHSLRYNIFDFFELAIFFFILIGITKWLNKQSPVYLERLN